MGVFLNPWFWVGLSVLWTVVSTIVGLCEAYREVRRH